MSNNSKPKIFISYSHLDEEWKDLIKNHFTASTKFEIWNDRDIPLGDKWFGQIKDSLHEADIGLLLITEKFLNSDFIKNEEIPYFLQACDAGKVRVVIFMIRSCAWEQVDWIANWEKGLQGYPKDYKPLASFRKFSDTPIDECENIANVIKNLVNELYNIYYKEKEEEEFEKEKEKLLNPYNEILNLLREQNSTIEEIKNISKHYLENIHFNELQNLTTIEEIVSKLYDLEKLPCVVKELFGSNLPTEVSLWLTKQQAECNRILTEAENEENEPRLVVIFDSKHEDKKYSIRFITHNIPGINDQNDDNGGKVYDLDKEDSRIELIKDMMKYIENKNPLVDLILPTELMTEDINLWEAEWNESLSRLAKVNIRAKRRYDINDKSIKQRYIEQWESKQQYEELYPINNENEIRKIGNNMDKAGLSSKYILKEKHLKYILKTDMSFIMLWQTTDTDFDLTNLHSEGLDKLRQNYYTLIKNKSINLMWDNPKTYYYPN